MEVEEGAHAQLLNSLCTVASCLFPERRVRVNLSEVDRKEQRKFVVILHLIKWKKAAGMMRDRTTSCAIGTVPEASWRCVKGIVGLPGCGTSGNDFKNGRHESVSLAIMLPCVRGHL